jgi:hypothetical protein
MFNAILDRHPGCKIIDVSFSVRSGETTDLSAEDFDLAMADSIQNAKQVFIEDLRN